MKVRITSIKVKEEEVDVYNFAVAEDESYVINGVVSHNCRCTIAPTTKGLDSLRDDDNTEEFEKWLNG